MSEEYIESFESLPAEESPEEGVDTEEDALDEDQDQGEEIQSEEAGESSETEPETDSPDTGLHKGDSTKTTPENEEQEGHGEPKEGESEPKEDTTAQEHAAATSEAQDDGDVLEELEVYGEKVKVPRSVMRANYQKALGAEKRFREADQAFKAAETFWERLSDVQSRGVGGMPLPFQTLIQALARKHFNGSLAQAQEYLHNELLPSYVDSQSQFSDHPELRDLQWQKYDISQREAKIRQKEQQHVQKEQDLRVHTQSQTWKPVLLEALRDAKVDPRTTEAEKAAKFLLGKIIKGDKITRETVTDLVAQAAKEIEDLAARKLRELTPAQIQKLNPQLSAKLLEEYSRKVKNTRPTSKGKATKSTSTKPRRRTREPQYADTLDELVKHR